MLKKLLDRPVAVIMAIVAVMILGIVSSNVIPVSLVPDVDIPNITVQISSPGSPARELDESAVKVLRQQLIQVADLKDIRTETKDGSGTIFMQFNHGSDIDFLFIEVNEKIDRAMGSLPSGVDRPKVLKASATDIPAFYINMTVKGEDDNPEPDNELFPVSPKFTELSNFAGQVIVRRIEQLAQVAMVDVSGYVYPELLIIPNLDKLGMAGITTRELEAAIEGANLPLGNLTIRDGEYQFNVRFQANISTREDIENVYLDINGRIYLIKDLARVVEHPQSRNGLVRSDGRDAVTLAVIKQSDAKMADLRRSINGLMDNFRRSYPDIDFTVTRDQTALLDYSINNLIQNIIVGALLACLVILLFMKNYRSSLLVVMTIPTALILSLLFFYILGLTINIISLSGLVLGVGMMVDNSIIVVDNITFRLGRGEPLKDAVAKGTGEVFAPMLSSVLTTCSVFVPLIFLSGTAGALFYDQAMAVVITLFSSLLVTMTLIPVFYYLFYKGGKRQKPNKMLEKLSFDNMFDLYEKILKWFFRRRYVMWGIFAVSLAGIFIIFKVITKEQLPPLAYSDMLITIEWNERISAQENDRRTETMLAVVGDDLEQVTVMAGVQQFILSHTRENSVSEAVVYIKTGDEKALEDVRGRITAYMETNHPEAVFGFEASGNIFDMVFADKEAKLVARLRSTAGQAPEPGELNELLAEISAKNPDIYIPPVAYEEHVSYIPKPEIMALYGVSSNELNYALRNKLNENQLFTIVQGRFSVPVTMGDRRSRLNELLYTTYITKNDLQIPVSTFIHESRDQDLKVIISGFEGDIYPIDLDVNDRDIPEVMESIRAVVNENSRFEVDFSGTYFSSREMVGELIMVLVVALLLLYFILASQFESLVQPLIIMSEIIVDLFGALTVMLVMGVSVNLMSLIGIIVMCGIVINDSILKIDTINKLRREKYSLIRAIFEGGKRRLNAIVMTSLTTILGVAPFLVRGDMGSDLQYPLSIALIGGMVIGTLVSIFFIPLAYYEIYKNKHSAVK